MSPRNEDLAKNLDQTNEMIKDILEGLHNNDIVYAELKVELNNLIGQGKDLSKSIKYSDGKIQDLQLKVALLEQSNTSLISKFEEYDKHSKQIELADRSGKWGTKAAYIGGILSFIASMAALAYSIFH
jgi:chromosome segregation ATPase